MAISRPFQIYPKQASVNRQQTSRRLPLPPPIGGWNTRDEPGFMPVEDAVELINAIPRQGYVQMRGGYEPHSYVDANSGVQSDGTNYLSAGDQPELDFGTGDFTIECIAKNDGSAGTSTSYLVAKKDGANAGWFLGYTPSNGRVSFQIEDGGGLSASMAETFALTEDQGFRHIAVAVDRTADTARLYLDGIEAAVSPLDISAVTGNVSNAVAFTTHANSSGGNVHSGIIDEVRAWNDVRTGTEILDNKNTEISGSSSGLVGYRTMNGSIGSTVSTVSDETTSSNDLTSTGAGSMSYAISENNVASDVSTVAEYSSGSTRRLITATASNIWNSTASGAATSLGSGFTNGRWDTAIMNGIMGFVNGDDTPQQYNGTTLSTLTITGSGLTSSNLIGIHTHKARSYFWEDDSQSFWYSATNALGGALTEFELGQIAKEGGKLLRMASWTVDGGSGPDDYAVFIMSSGEVIVYQGSDPGSALSWGLVGIYKVGEPVGDRAIEQFGKELLVVVEDDIISLPTAFQTEAPPATKLSGAITDAVKAYGGNDGWEVLRFPTEQLMIVNVPVSVDPDLFEQYVLNTQTGSPCRFTSLPARSWGVYNKKAYFGSTDGVVYKFNDIDSDNGQEIDVSSIHSWQTFGASQNLKVTALRPTFDAEGTLAFDIKAGYDFKAPTVSSPSSSVAGGTPWGSPWGSPWSSGGTQSIQGKWRIASGRGNPVTIALKFSRKGDRPKWLKTDVMAEQEGNL